MGVRTLEGELRVASYELGEGAVGGRNANGAKAPGLEADLGPVRPLARRECPEAL